jgi:hypothetical protein
VQSNLNRRSIVLITIVVVACLVLSTLSIRQMLAIVNAQSANVDQPTPAPTVAPTVAPTSLTSNATVTPTPTPAPVLHNGPIMGVNGDPRYKFNGIYWIRLSYLSCGVGNLKGSQLTNTIRNYHQQGIHILLIICGPLNSGNDSALKEVAHSGADAIQCGNEQMKYGPDAATFAGFYNACESNAHAVRPGIPVLMGSLDPHVGGIDYQPLVDQVSYLDQMQATMNSRIHPGGHWKWRDHTIGLIDSWHNGYPSAATNSLKGLFDFWAQQFNVNTSSNGLGRHLWVIEGTGCFKGCGLNVGDSAEIAIAHILTLTTDVQTAINYNVPFFYFSGEDFVLSDGVLWPIGLLDVRGHPKPLRQDLSMGARILAMFCWGHTRIAKDQVQLLADLYDGCRLPGNYIDILTS